jgi:hypothetical protein
MKTWQRSVIVSLIALVLLIRAMVAQASQPIAALEVGAGNAFGGLGARATAFAFGGRVGLGIGLGVFAASPGQDPILGAATVRYYLVRGPHGVYAGLSWSALHAYGDDDQWSRSASTVTVLHGPGVMAGYRFASRGGFTITVGGGAGRTTLGIAPIVELGLGWRWRRTAGQ